MRPWNRIDYDLLTEYYKLRSTARDAADETGYSYNAVVLYFRMLATNNTPKYPLASILEAFRNHNSMEAAV